MPSYERFLSDRFFPGKRVVLVPAEYSRDAETNDVVHIKIGDGDDYPIHQLGDGMQSLIICTYPIITESQQASLFFLEEPDLCMHPSLQRIFLDVLKEYHLRMGHQFFLTTHSNHLLDLLEDDQLVSIFSFSEIESADFRDSEHSPPVAEPGSGQSVPAPRFRIRLNSPGDREALAQLGVRPSSTYLANATIWVEGTTDCSYLRAYMKALIYYLESCGGGWGEDLAGQLKRYREDRHYAFVEYNGSNLSHFSFVDGQSENGGNPAAERSAAPSVNANRLCAQALVIADGDLREKPSRAIAFEEQLGDRFIILPGKEIENLIPEALMKWRIWEDSRNKRLKKDWPESPDLGELAKILDGIDYAAYARMDARGNEGSRANAEQAALKGVGSYLCQTLGLPGYADGSTRGTLPDADKKRWAKKIPDQILNLFDEKSAESAFPDFLTHDIVWLCVCIFEHLAECNHDDPAKTKLKGFKTWIKESRKHLGPPSGADLVTVPPSNSGNTVPPSQDDWPIPPPSNNTPENSPTAYHRLCLLTMYLDSLSAAD